MTAKRLPIGLNLGLWDRMTSWDDAVEIARLADELGYHSVSIPESFGRDGFTLCDRLLAATENIHVCLGLANVFSRSPAVLAQTAATLDELSGGRFILGLGSSTPNLVEGWHGLQFSQPLQRTRETIEICHRIWDQDRSPYEGEIFKVEGVKLSFEPVRKRIPIWHGALLEKSLRLCGEKSDGWIPNLLPVEGLAAGAEAIDQAASGVGRDSSEVSIVGGMQLLVGEDTNALLQMLKFGVAVYYGPATSPYAKAASGLGYADDVATVQAAYAEGGSKAAIAATSDRLAQSVAIVGPIEDCRNRVTELLDGAADVINVTMPGPNRAACEPIMEGIIPDHLR
ncbi:LLM class flavin-dependent oxidoreductase [Halieaceae bacterium IMCC14734]|uniref:LLM class flavin-dependent oxidoreductase n=1 Tax=Candidatus Litorirhabdus singularis TaxID=2518993 RepID=A0ABT3TEE6_9GAMM|nr:LLM class flavin-dependent oxidoreductase [Candidatus Litorirhabdus singularis]MCX2980161.1 LLM class flavin-dependent oxidoreductase [Candidatus Litorirhabdus singularis]